MAGSRRPVLDSDVVVVGGRPAALPPGLRDIDGLRLRIWNVGFKRFDELAPLTNLVELTVLDWTAPTFEALRGLAELRRLTIIHFPRVGSLAALAGLTGLEELTLETLPSWDASRKRQSVESLAPLRGMARLRVLKLGGVGARDGDLSPLAALHALEALGLANAYPQRELAELAAALPQLQSNFLSPYMTLDGYACTHCGADKVMLSGSDIPNPKVVCPTCNRRKVDETVARFEGWRSAAMAPAGA